VGSVEDDECCQYTDLSFLFAVYFSLCCVFILLLKNSFAYLLTYLLRLSCEGSKHSGLGGLKYEVGARPSPTLTTGFDEVMGESRNNLHWHAPFHSR